MRKKKKTPNHSSLRASGSGYIILLTGISGSGKTTLGKALYKKLGKGNKRPIEFIDGDMARKFLEIKSGYTREERIAITKQIAYAADMIAKKGIDVIVCNIAGSYSVRDWLRRKWKRYIQIFLDADIKDCMNNDPKGVYKRALKSKTPYCYGIDVPYERPRNPDVVVYPYKESVKKSMERIEKYLRRKKCL